MRKKPNIGDSVWNNDEVFVITLTDAIGNITMQQMREDDEPDLRCIPIKIKDFDLKLFSTGISANMYDLKQEARKWK